MGTSRLFFRRRGRRGGAPEARTLEAARALRLERALEGAGMAAWACDLRTGDLVLEGLGLRSLELADAPVAVPGWTWLRGIHPHDRRAVRSAVADGADRVERVLRVRLPRTAVWRRVEVLGSLDVRRGRAAGGLREVSRLWEQATRDPLTGLASRSHLLVDLERCVAAARRDGSPLSVALVDLDDFKAVNDHHGHAAGDRVLSAAGQVVRSELRAADIGGRLGGDELCLVLPRTTADGAALVLDRLRRRLAELAHRGRDGRLFRVTVTCGVAELEPEHAGPHDLLEAADRALYAGKEAGRHATRVWRRGRLAGGGGAGVS